MTNIGQTTNPQQTLEQFPAIGTARASLFRKLGINRPIDLLFLFPREYVEAAELHEYHELSTDMRCSILGTVDSVEVRSLSEGRSTVGVLVRLERGFRSPRLVQPTVSGSKITRGQRVVATGVVKATGISYEMRHPEMRVLEEEEVFTLGKPRPIYPLTDGLQQRHVSAAVDAAIQTYANSVQESIPEHLRDKYGLVSILDALRCIHQGDSMPTIQSARYRFIFQELLVYQLALGIRRMKLKGQQASPVFKNSAAIHHRILNRLGLQLTGDQQQAIDEICADLEKPVAMNRLLQGDVGSGKTAVAIYAMLLAVANGYQVALMSPTEILARQHFERLSQSLAGADCAIELLVGSLTGTEKSDLQTQIALGTVDLVIGTQALLSDKVDFQKLGLVVIDEQHKFGVAQRAKLRGTGLQPHYLVLSATPIPRTLAMSAFGDLDVSTIREKPAGRSVIHTYLGSQNELASWWDFVRKKVGQGRQAYVIAPRVEADESSEVQGATAVYKHLVAGEMSEMRVALLHGKMDADIKNSTLREFEDGQIDVLVSTTMVEVGIDIANASVMTILDADRLGLAQLHQLRGRVGRGNHQGYVCVFPKIGAEETSLSKLEMFSKISDGFELAELDLQMRGPGNLLGTHQTGIPALRIADIVRDKDILLATRQAAEEILALDPNLSAPEYAHLKRQVLSRHGGMIDFGDVG